MKKTLPSSRHSLKLTDNVSPKPSERFIKGFAFLLLIFAAALFLVSFFYIIRYELRHAYNADCSLYWAVGRGMLNGLTPYSDMYENKPVGIFALSALAFLVSDDAFLCNMIVILSLLIIALVPALILYGHFRSGREVTLTREGFIIALAVVLTGGTLLAVYCETRAKNYQPETIGSAFALLYMLSVTRLEFAETKVRRLLWTVLAAIFIGCTAMMKEPLWLTGMLGTLLLTDNGKTFLRSIVIPNIIGAAAAFAVLAVTGVLKPYITIYLRLMFSTRVSGETSLLERTVKVSRLAKSLLAFQPGILIMLAVSAVLLVAYPLYRQKKLLAVFRIICLLLAFFGASFCVSLGRYFYNHHYIFAVPVYAAVIIGSSRIILSLPYNKDFFRKAAAVSAAVIMLTSVHIPSMELSADSRAKFSRLRTNAEYVDRILDDHDIERYQFVGFNLGQHFFGLTKHSPQGAVFVQDPDNFETADTWFSKSFLEQLENSELIIVYEMSHSEVFEEAKEILDRDFVLVPPESLCEPQPEDFPYSIYIRRDKQYKLEEV